MHIDDSNSPQAVIVEYVEACRVGSVERLKAIFHPDALMAGFYGGEFHIGTPDPFFDEVRDTPSPAATGAEYTGEITTVEEFGGMASITLKETGYFGSSFTNWFHLARQDGSWKIISKSYQDGQSGGGA